MVVQLRPTHPVRDVADIDKCIEIMLENPVLDCVRTIMPAPHTPYKMWFKVCYSVIWLYCVVIF